MAKQSYSAQNAWKNKTYDRVVFLVKKGEKEKIEMAARNAGYKSTAKYIIDCINAHEPGLLTPLDDTSREKKAKTEDPVD